MKIVSDKILNDAHVFIRELSVDSELTAQEKVDIVARRLETIHILPRASAIDVACKSFSEYQAINIPAHIDIDNSTCFCIVLREQGNPEPIYLSIASLFGRIQQQRLQQEAD